MIPMRPRLRCFPLRRQARLLVGAIIVDLCCRIEEWRKIGDVWVKRSEKKCEIGICTQGHIICYDDNEDVADCHEIWVPWLQQLRLRRVIRRLNITHARRVLDGLAD